MRRELRREIYDTGVSEKMDPLIRELYDEEIKEQEKDDSADECDELEESAEIEEEVSHQKIEFYEKWYASNPSIAPILFEVQKRSREDDEEEIPPAKRSEVNATKMLI